MAIPVCASVYVSVPVSSVFVSVCGCLLVSAPLSLLYSPLFTGCSGVLYSFSSLLALQSVLLMAAVVTSMPAVQLHHLLLQLLLLLHFSGDLTDLEVQLELNLEAPNSKKGDETDTQSWYATLLELCMLVVASRTVSCWGFLPL